MLRAVIMVLVLLMGGVTAAGAAPTTFSIAFYYAPHPPLEELQAFDIVVVDPDAAGVSPTTYRTGHSELFAYVSIGEADPQRDFFKSIDPRWLIGDNPAWKSRLVDLENPDWRAFFLDQVLEPLWAAGYRGFFLDTLDSYQLIADKGRHPQLKAGLVSLIHGIKQRHPEARLILNRGFEVLDQVKDVAFAVAAESLFRTFDPLTGAYAEVKEQDRPWLLERLNEVRRAGLPAIAIEYLQPGERELARQTARQVSALGLIPWVTDKDVSSLGLGTIEVLPRTVLGLYDGSEGPDPVYTNLQRYAVTPLNYLGYQVELHDMRQPLPAGILAGRYAGVVIWPNAGDSGVEQRLAQWLQRVFSEGVPVAFLERFGLPFQELSRLGLDYRPRVQQPQQVRIMQRDPLVGFEAEPTPNAGSLVPVQGGKQSRPLLSLGDGEQLLSEAVAITDWGGYALEPFVVREGLGGKILWMLDPFGFFQQALRLPLIPVPDVTTENGVRLLLSHIDADGFESRVERADAPLAVAELREKVLKKYRIPTTFSVITSALGDRGVMTPQFAQLQQEAREVFALPWIEAGSHTYSHPFYWDERSATRSEYTSQHLAIPGYTLSLTAEIPDTVTFIEQHLLPAGKPVKLLQWSGNCEPNVEALALSYQSGLLNINGGDTIMTESYRSLAAVAPLGIFKGGYFQVFAPNQNENVYTNGWTGPFYGYRRVIETFKLTDEPRRLKPINIYYHVYSATKEASRRALDDVYRWALGQRPHAIFTSAYVAKVLDFNRTAVARQGAGWLIRNHGDLKQVRIPRAQGYPDLQSSRNLLGYNDHGDSRYLHLGPGGEAFVQLTDQPPKQPYLKAAGGEVTSFARSPRGLRLTVRMRMANRVTFGEAGGCRLTSAVSGRGIRQELSDGSLSVELAEGAHDLALDCP